MLGRGYNSDQVLENMLAASQVFPLNSMSTEYKYFGIFGRLNYRWEGKIYN